MAWLRSSTALTALLSLASCASAAKLIVKVGAGGKFEFDPKTLRAQVGDTVEYNFFARNHSVTESTFAEPCKPKAGGFYSGFVASPSPDVASATSFTIKINNTSPIWVYCGQTNGDHCQSGMVHAINAAPDGGDGNTFQKFDTAARAAQKPSTSPPGGPPGGLPVGGLRKLKINVGLPDKLVYDPPNSTAPAGTIIEFKFNPLNHSIVQSSFDLPCQPLANGFSAPFIPTQIPSGVTFEVAVKDDKPLWFYCPQTAKTHCQVGMVGSINAPLDGDKTFDRYRDLAGMTTASTIQPKQPNGGQLKVNGTIVKDVKGVVFDSSKDDDTKVVDDVPPPKYDYGAYMEGMAGGAAPMNYNWGPSITDNATMYLQQLQYIDNFVVKVLWFGWDKLRHGNKWHGLYPDSIFHTIGSCYAQATFHRAMYIDSLGEFNKPIVGACAYNIPDVLEDWLQVALEALTISMSATLHVVAQATDQDHWMVAALASNIGAKARMLAVISMMKNHMAASAPREPFLDPKLAWAHIDNKYVQSGSCKGQTDLAKRMSVMKLKSWSREGENGHLDKMVIEMPAGGGEKWVTYLGPWGSIKFSDIATDGSTEVPDDTYGYVFALLTSKKNIKASEVAGLAESAPILLWTGGQCCEKFYLGADASSGLE